MVDNVVDDGDEFVVVCVDGSFLFCFDDIFGSLCEVFGNYCIQVNDVDVMID